MDKEPITMADMKQILNSSNIILSVRWLNKRYCYLKEKMLEVYKNSQIYRLNKWSWNAIKICLRYSFLGKVSKINGNNNFIILNNSEFVRWLLGRYKNFRYRLIDYSRTSMAINPTEEIKNGLYFLPLKAGGAIVITAIFTNILFSLLVHKETGLLTWIARSLFLFIGLGGIFCNVDWLTLQSSSIILRWISKYQKG